MFKSLIFTFMLLSASTFCYDKRKNMDDTYTFTSDFASIIQTPYFVDKSTMINDFFNTRLCGILITAPPRFGKSTNMNMIKRFCEIVVDEKGNRIPKDETENFKIFTSKHKKICRVVRLDVYEKKNQKFFNEHFGQYPVLFMDFKVLNGTSFNNFTTCFRLLVNKIFRMHSYLLQSNCVEQDRKEFFNKFYSIQIFNTSNEELCTSIMFLSELLQCHFDKRVIVLIDEYDAPIKSAIFQSEQDIKKIVDFMKSFISNLLKSNRFIERALLNACLRLSEITMTDANNTEHLPFAHNHPFKMYFGFTSSEVAILAKRFRVSTKVIAIQQWYNGYKVINSSRKLFNTFSTVKYFQSKTFDNYWVQSGCLLNLDKIILMNGILNEIKNAIEGKLIRIIYTENITANHIETLRDIVVARNYSDLDNNGTHLFLSILLDFGYLTVTEKQGNYLMASAPNKEVRRELKCQLHSVSYFKQKLNVTNEDVDLYLNSLCKLQSNGSSYMAFARSVLNLFTHTEMPEDEDELKDALAVFPRFRTDLFLKVITGVSLNTNKKDSSGNYVPFAIDMLIVRNDRTGIILQVTYDNNLQHQRVSLYGSLQQIVENDGYSVFQTVNVTNKILLGVVIKDKDNIRKVPLCSVSALYNSLDFMRIMSVCYFKESK